MSKEFQTGCETKHGKVQTWCRGCKRQTNHSVLHCTQENYEDDNGYGFSATTHYQIVQCLGCDAVSFRKTYSDDAMVGPDYEDFEEVSVYPEPAGSRALIDDDFSLPVPLERIYKETVGALNSKHNVLSTIGIRAILETIAKDLGATGRNLYDKINSLVALGQLTQTEADILHKVRDIGNDAAHDVEPPSKKVLSLALTVVEHLMQKIYILPSKARDTFKQ